MRSSNSLIMSALALVIGGSASAGTAAPPNASAIKPYIIEASSSSEARRSVDRVGAQVDRTLDIIHAVSARLSDSQVARLKASPGVEIFADRTLGTSANTAVVTRKSAATSLVDGTGVSTPIQQLQTNYTAEVGADTLQAAGTTGKGVTIAILDTGLYSAKKQNFDSRILATIDVTKSGAVPVTSDPYGHGTHVTSIAAGGARNIAGGYFGVAPAANLVIVRAFDGSGAGSYANVIAGLNWLVANRAKYNIRVLNLSFGAPAQSNYWNDPLDRAVMAAWKAGIVVVVAAGNEGPSPMTIDVPGNVPYVITVGAITDNYTPYVYTDDRLASFSSTGPTYEGFVKPEVVAPGGHALGSMQSTSYLANIDPGSMNHNEELFTMSGTSQAAAVTSGVVALMLQADPTLTPDGVKCQLMASARPALNKSGALAYSVFQQGAGLINAVAATNSSSSGCANVGLDINADLAGTAHFGGPANQDAQGRYYVMDMSASAAGRALSGDGLSWGTAYVPGAYAFSEGYLWSKGFLWSKGYLWSKNVSWTTGEAFAAGYLWSKSVPWWTVAAPANSKTAPASIENWVKNQ